MKIFLTVTFILISPVVCSETLNIPASKDNTLIETNTLALSNGVGEYFFAGRTNQQGNSVRRGLLQFDLSAIPAGSTINDATLEITSTQSIAGLQTLTLHAVTQDWGESTSNSSFLGGGMGAPAEIGDATWTNAFHEGAAWNTAGGDFVASPTASTTANGLGLVTFNSLGLKGDVQDWLDGTSANYGWLILGNESSAPTAFRFNSRENLTTPPRLLVDYSLPQVSLNPSKDNTLYETIDGAISNGAGDRVFIGKPNNGLIRRAVMEFDVSSIPGIATITSVALDLTVIDIPGSAQSGTAALHLALSEWGEAGSNGSGQGAPSQTGDATWIHSFFDTENWINAGGDYMPEASDSFDFTAQSTTISLTGSANLIADVTTWVRNSDNNHGWVLLGDESNNGNSRSLGSSENSIAGNRPVLTVEYFIAVDLIFADGFELP